MQTIRRTEHFEEAEKSSSKPGNSKGFVFFAHYNDYSDRHYTQTQQGRTRMKSNQLHTGVTIAEHALNKPGAEVRATNLAVYRSVLSRITWGLAIATPFLAGIATAADVAAQAGGQTNSPAPKLTLAKPAWLTDLSISTKESYDDNVYLSGTDSSKYPAGIDLSRAPAGVAVGLKNKPSFVTTVSPKIGINFAPLLGDQKVFQVLSLGYSPDFVNYAGKPTESYNAHRLALGVKGKAGDVSFSLDNGLNAIDGSRFGPIFPGGLNSAYATGTLRERRNQYQDRNTVTIQYDQEKFFIRPTSSLLYYDLRTAQLTRAQAGGLAGYQNYADRYDLNGGADVGYKVTPQFAATVGYRYGTQYQEKYSHAIDALGLSSSSDYQRILFGFEGKPFSWLDAKLQIGPDIRKYGPNAAVANRDVLAYYGEASLTATITPKDSVSFKYKQYQWVSSTGRAPYFDSSFDLNYRRKLTSKLTLDLGAKFAESDYTSGLDATRLPRTKAPNPRDDSQTTFSGGLAYAFNPYASVNIAYAFDAGRNLQKGIANDSTREFEHNLVTVGANFKF